MAGTQLQINITIITKTTGVAGSVAALLRFFPYNGSKVYIYFYLYNNVVSHLEYLSGGKVN